MGLLWAVVFFGLGSQMASGDTGFACGIMLGVSGYLLGSMMEG